MSYLLDTNVISELRKRDRCDPGVRAWIGDIREGQLHTSVLVIGEIRRGIERTRARDVAYATRLEGWLADIQTRLEDRIHPVSQAVAEERGRLAAPRRRPIVDTLVAATAIVHSLTLVTSNVRDIADTGVRYLNPLDPIR